MNAKTKRPASAGSAWINLAVDYGPLLVFFLAYRHFTPKGGDAGLAAVDDETGGSLALAGEGEGMGRSSRTASVTAGVDSWANTELSGAVEGTGSDATGGEGTGRRVVITVVEATYAAESGLVLTKTTKTPGESGTVITPQRLGALRPTFLMRSTGNVPEVE